MEMADFGRKFDLQEISEQTGIGMDALLRNRESLLIGEATSAAVAKIKYRAAERGSLAEANALLQLINFLNNFGEVMDVYYLSEDINVETAALFKALELATSIDEVKTVYERAKYKKIVLLMDQALAKWVIFSSQQARSVKTPLELRGVYQEAPPGHNDARSLTLALWEDASFRCAERAKTLKEFREAYLGSPPPEISGVRGKMEGMVFYLA